MNPLRMSSFDSYESLIPRVSQWLLCATSKAFTIERSVVYIDLALSLITFDSDSKLNCHGVLH